MSLLEVKNLSFSYGTQNVFSEINFSVEEGQIFCLVGPNGCGKTTLEACILSHLKPQQGGVFIQGRNILGFSSCTLAAEIAFVPQSHTRSFPYNTLDVVTMGRMRRQKLLESEKQHREAALTVMEALDISHLAQTEYTTLSGGELQMVLLARALVQESRILVLDEPAAHLDVKRTHKILGILTRLAKEHGKTVLLSTHDYNHPLLFQDAGADVKMALMDKGHIRGIGAPLELLSSDLLHKIYGIHSQVLTVQAEKARHYLATWDD